MSDGLSALGIALAAFIATNIDDIVILVVFFANRAYTGLAVVVGQYIGIGALVAASLAIAAATQLIATEWTRWLGILPIAIGLRWLLALLRSGPADDYVEIEEPRAGRVGQVMSVAVVTIANGADNLAVYSPMFAASTLPAVVAIVGTFAVLTGAWCFAAYLLTHNPVLEQRVVQFGRITAPLVLIAIGARIVIGS